jgi:methionine-rich copper-binding protein CopC
MRRLTLPVPARAALAALAALALLGGPPAPARAHTDLASVVPADGAAVADPPIEVVLTFTDPLADSEAAQVEVVDPLGDDLVAAPPVVEGAVVTVPLNLAVAEGVHEVRYVVIAEDEHRLEGVTTFTFAPPADVATPPDATPTPTAAAPTDAATASDPADAVAGVASPPEPTPGASSSTGPAPTAAATSTEGAEGTGSASDGGIPPALGILLAVLAMAAVGAVVVRRGGAHPDGGI